MIEPILRLLSREAAAFHELVLQLRKNRAAFATARGDELTRLYSGLLALEAPREAATRELQSQLVELGRRLGMDGTRPPTLRRLLDLLPARDRTRLSQATAATREAAAAARLELAVGERLLQLATQAQEDFLRDLIGSLDQSIEAAAMVDVKG